MNTGTDRSLRDAQVNRIDAYNKLYGLLLVLPHRRTSAQWEEISRQRVICTLADLREQRTRYELHA